MIHQFDGAVDDEACARLVAAHDAVAQNERRDVVHRATRLGAAQRRAANMLDQLARRCEAKAAELFPEHSLVIETVLLSRLGIGGRHRKHADNCELDGRPNRTPDRVVSAIYYLNSDFAGGEIVFDAFALTIKPQRGMLLMFPSDLEHAHEVMPVTAGRRYTVAIWLKPASPPVVS